MKLDDSSMQYQKPTATVSSTLFAFQSGIFNLHILESVTHCQGTVEC